ncbi:MAG: hypothetical protein AAF842_11025 [Planctomycetota bacterium]
MARRRTWLMLIAALVAIWGGLGALAWLSSTTAPTAARVAAYLDDHPLDADGADRDAIIDGLASRVNRLDFEQRQDPALRERIESIFGEMTPAERNRYIDAVLPKGMEQLIAAINAMDRDERQQLVDNALTEIRRARAEGPDPERVERMESEAFQRVVDEGMRNYLSGASAEAKLDLEPVVIEMQNMLRELR